MKRSRLKRNHIIQLLLSILTVLLIGFVSSRVFFRIDLTTDNRYSINESTKKALQDLDDIVYVKVYLDGDLPAAFEELRRSVLETMEEFRAYAGSNIQYEFINPAESEDQKTRNEIARQLVDKGLNPRTIRVEDKDGYKTKYLFPGAVIMYRQEEVVLNFIESKGSGRTAVESLINDAQEKLEYNFLNKIREVTSVFPATIAFITGHGELERSQSISLARELSDMYSVKLVDPDEYIYALRDSMRLKYDAIVIAKPRTTFSEKDKFIIDQYIMHGGKVLWLVDYNDVHMDSLARKSTTQAIPIQRQLNLNDMLFSYGVRINTGIIQDLRSAPIPVNTAAMGAEPQFTPTPWVYFPVIAPRPIHPITTNIGPIKTEFTNPLDTVGRNPNVKKQILLKTSQYSRVVSSPALIDLSIINEKPDPQRFRSGPQNVAVLLEGNFQSAFKNRLVDDFTQNSFFDFKEKSKKTKMILVSDGDVAKNPVITRNGDQQSLPLGSDKWFEDINFSGNKPFLLNAVNYLTDDNELVTLRGRKFELRLLDRQKLRNEKTFWRALNIGLPIVVMLILAFVFYFLRRAKYTQKSSQ
ncbi:MAG TPA: gliding motility-associated ABC transporter substrate-binding protein GldG [Salinivirga sp.]|uniref:gliding motility-associated ABC transporter substrate-binding protein GldG n=1 Tax=Salinivirga sp. TaxID=1970192 RepID=UPI002B466E5D|nr:gliding motility-associated ABC transporter substrate-binding protein GldG [Salinivirga sp.]HKK58101.1 gliding motility-associated ABC transporter substrate-binding protein GldG [Salinivirga sp.]